MFSLPHTDCQLRRAWERNRRSAVPALFFIISLDIRRKEERGGRGKRRASHKRKKDRRKTIKLMK